MADEETNPDRLQSPESEASLYHSRHDEVSVARPVLTGDVFDDVAIPGLGDASGLAVILTHPCTMRKDGVHLVDRVMVARVRDHPNPVPIDKWHRANTRIMPLPGLGVTDVPNAAAHFLEASLCSSDALRVENRLTCLSELGINLLQQRFIFHMTRFVVPTSKLHAAAVQVFREVELHEEWADDAVSGGQDVEAAAAEFHAWIRAEPEDAPGRSRQDRLNDPQQVAAIRRELRAALAARRTGHTPE